MTFSRKDLRIPNLQLMSLDVLFVVVVVVIVFFILIFLFYPSEYIGTVS